MTSNQMFELLLAQTWQVGLLAVAVWTIVWLCGRDRPHLSHCLWALVLLKCLMPPVWTSPVGLFCWINAQTLQLTSSQWFAHSTSAPQKLAGVATTNSNVEIQISNAFDSGLTLDTSSLQSGSAESSTQPPATFFDRGQQWVLRVWLVGCVVSLAIAVSRLSLFWRFVRHSTLPREQAVDGVNMEALVQRLSEKLVVGRRVRVSVLDAAVGPAVYGLIRPTILLPAAIIQGRSQRELEPLVAHELIHIRRGDLWWALVQTLACCLFWFHPLVWLAQAMLQREAELSCDEETIAGLDCSPAVYARSLLDVLESKQRLRVAPALPGVRPVDVTRNRLERIMRLGQGSHARTPAWIWLLFFGSVAVLLPGGAWLKAQEDVKDSSNQAVVSESAENASLPLAPPATGAWAESWHNENIEVGDLLDQLEAQHGDRDVARGMLLSMIPQRSVHQLNAEGIVKISAVPAFSIEGDELHVFETREQIANIHKGLDELRRFGFDSVRLQLRLLAISAVELETLGLEWENAAEPSSELMARASEMVTPQEIQAARGLPKAPAAFKSADPVQPASAVAEAKLPIPVGVVKQQTGQITLGTPVPSDLGIAGWLVVDERPQSSKVTTHCAVIDDDQVAAIAKLTENGDQETVLGLPRVTCRNGGYAQMASHAPWSIRPQFASFDRPAPNEPKPKLGFSGFSVTAGPLIVPESEGNGISAIALSMVCESREVTRLDTFTFEGQQTNGAKHASATTTIQQPYVELKELAVHRKLRLGESLLISSRKPLAPTSDNKILVVVATCEVLPAGMIRSDNGQLKKLNVRRPQSTTERLSIPGVLTSGPEVKKLPAPSTGEILSAWSKANPDDQALMQLDDSNIQFVKNCLGDFADEKTFIPLIGEAILHHRIYKCDAYQITERGKSGSNGVWLGSIAIDHNHYHAVDIDAGKDIFR